MSQASCSTKVKQQSELVFGHMGTVTSTATVRSKAPSPQVQPEEA